MPFFNYAITKNSQTSFSKNPYLWEHKLFHKALMEILSVLHHYHGMTGNIMSTNYRDKIKKSTGFRFIVKHSNFLV